MRRRLAIGLMMFTVLFGAMGAVSTGVIAEGTRWEMTWRVHESGQPGPTVRREGMGSSTNTWMWATNGSCGWPCQNCAVHWGMGG